MRRILKMLARMYPAAWRARYGAEYEALLEDAEPRARDGFDVLWGAVKMRITTRSFVRIVLPCALLGALAAVGISFSRPAIYRSETVVTVKSEQGQKVDDVILNRVQQAWPTPYLATIIQKDDLYAAERTRMPMKDVVDLMRKNIQLRRLQTRDGKVASAFVVQFDYADPRLAQTADEELTSQLVSANLRAMSAAATADFLRDQLSMAYDPVTKQHIRAKLQQSEAIVSLWHGTFAVLNRASFPKKPLGLGRMASGIIGLLAGLVDGMIAAAMFGSRRRLIS